jgi:hypothetical protein
MEWRAGLIQPSISGDMYAIVRMIAAPFLMLADFFLDKKVLWDDMKG